MLGSLKYCVIWICGSFKLFDGIVGRLGGGGVRNSHQSELAIARSVEHEKLLHLSCIPQVGDHQPTWGCRMLCMLFRHREHIIFFLDDSDERRWGLRFQQLSSTPCPLELAGNVCFCSLAAQKWHHLLVLFSHYVLRHSHERSYPVLYNNLFILYIIPHNLWPLGWCSWQGVQVATRSNRTGDKFIAQYALTTTAKMVA